MNLSMSVYNCRSLNYTHTHKSEMEKTINKNSVTNLIVVIVLVTKEPSKNAKEDNSTHT